MSTIKEALTQVDKAALQQLIEHIAAAPEEKFDMSSLQLPGCGSAGCIGGFAASLWPECVSTWPRGGGPDGEATVNGWDVKAVRKKLGMTESLARLVCFPADEQHDGWDMWLPDYASVNKGDAIVALEAVRDGKEDFWDHVRDQGGSGAGPDDEPEEPSDHG